jgi:tRNA1Val (adenine37-N6)-methyltransferase
MFKFKQFSVDQTGCAMKINTDGVLLGAMAVAETPSSILDIGTGTGVIALMLAQRFSNSKIDAVEIDAQAAETADRNFKNSSFRKRLNIYASSIGTFLDEHPDNRYDFIVSNPPFYINSLESPEERKSTAKHTDASFFETLMKDISWHLPENGCCWLIFPFQEVKLVSELMALNRMYLQKSINIHSFEHSEPHRQIVCFGLNKMTTETTRFVIYESKDIYTSEYKILLAPYFLNF